MTGLRHAADGRLELPVLGVPARGGPGARRADRHRRRACSASATRWRSTSSATARRRCARCCRCSSARRTAPGARRSRSDVARLVEADRGRARCSDADPINPQRVFWELSPRLPDDCILTADSGSAANWYARDLKLRARDDGVALGHARDDGAGRAVRDRREVRAPRPAGDRARRRRRDADERHQRADHDREVLAALERPAARRARAQQPRPEPGHLGAARDGGRPEVRGLAGRCPDFPYARYAELLGLDGHPRRRPRARSAPPGTRRSPPTGRCVLEAITDPEVPPLPPHITLEQAKTFMQRAARTATRTRGAMIRQAFAQKLAEFLPGR